MILCVLFFLSKKKGFCSERMVSLLCNTALFCVLMYMLSFVDSILS